MRESEKERQKESEGEREKRRRKKISNWNERVRKSEQNEERTIRKLCVLCAYTRYEETKRVDD